VVDSILFVNSLTISRLEGFCLGSKPMWGIRSMSSRNRGCCVAEWTWLLCWNSAIGRRLYQSSCYLLMNRQRNWSSSWLTCFICPSVWGCQAIEEDIHIPSSLYSSLVNRATNWGPLMGIKRFDHETKVKARSERRNLQTASQLCTKQVGTGKINQIIESLLKVKVRRITKTY